MMPIYVFAYFFGVLAGLLRGANNTIRRHRGVSEHLDAAWRLGTRSLGVQDAPHSSPTRQDNLNIIIIIARATVLTVIILVRVRGRRWYVFKHSGCGTIRRRRAALS